MDPVNSFGEVLEWTGLQPGTTPLGLRVRGLYRRPDRSLIVALIPAHNEEDQIENAIRSLREQQAPPDLIVVCADNCTDETGAKAEALGAFVLETVANADKKAGALNQALDILLPELADDDAVLVMDADSVLLDSRVHAQRPEHGANVIPHRLEAQMQGRGRRAPRPYLAG